MCPQDALMPANQPRTAERPLRRGDAVDIRPADEILATLDADGKLEGMPFMPEMVPFCGQRHRVFRRAEKTCVEGAGIRLLGGNVFLEGLRCDGAFHEGCQRGCLFFWNEAWLKPVGDGISPLPPGEGPGVRASPPGEAPTSGYPGVRASPPGEAPTSGYPGVRARPVAPPTLPPTRRNGRFYCQSTELLAATRPLPPLGIRHFWRDFISGEERPGRLARIFARQALNKIRRTVGLKPYGAPAGDRPGGPKGDLDLQPGEWVEVRSREEILATLDPDGKNRGLSFEVEMLEHCGRRYRVAYPVRKIILEMTGAMAELVHTVILDGVACEGTCAKSCPRRNYFYWRESWLRRVAGPPPQQ